MPPPGGEHGAGAGGPAVIIGCPPGREPGGHLAPGSLGGAGLGGGRSALLAGR